MNRSSQRRWLRRGIGLCGLLVAVVAAIWWLQSPPPYNVLLVTLDTTRADHIGCYGYADAHTPNIDALANDGVLFEHAYVTVPLTLPAHTSILTGLYPPENGVRLNGQGPLDPELPNLAETLRQAGYQTGAFLASVVLHSRYGLNHGFDVYDDDMAGGEQHGHESHLMRKADSVVNHAMAWLNQIREEQPFLCWVHLFDPHAPYEGHPEVFGERFQDRPYDGDIAFADLHIGRLIASLKERGLYDRTLIVVVGDHGEGLGDHQEGEHGLMLYNSTVQVPLIVSNPTKCLAGHRVTAPISQVDILPTVLDCLDLPLPEQGSISGRSLSAALDGSPIEPRVCYSESESVYEVFGWAPLASVTNDTWKYVKTTREELYNLKDDPAEMNNLAESQPDQLERMQELFAQVQQGMTTREAARGELTDVERRKLESLGYLAGGPKSEPASEGESLPDVKDMIAYYNTEIAARALISDGRLDEAIAQLRDVIRAAPNFIPARMTLGMALLEQSRDVEAVEVFEAAIEVSPDSSAPHFELGKHYAAEGRTEKAIEHYRTAVRLNPQDATSHFNLGSLLLSQGNVEQARAHYQQGLEEFPDSTVGNFNFSVLLAGQGELKSALQHARRAAELSAHNPQIRFQLGTIYASMGNFKDAVRQFETTLQLDPGYSRGQESLNQARLALSGQ